MSGRIFTQKQVSQVLSNRARKLNEEIHKLEMDNINLHTENIKLYKENKLLKGLIEDDGKSDQRGSVTSNLRQYSRQAR